MRIIRSLGKGVEITTDAVRPPRDVSSLLATRFNAPQQGFGLTASHARAVDPILVRGDGTPSEAVANLL